LRTDQSQVVCVCCEVTLASFMMLLLQAPLPVHPLKSRRGSAQSAPHCLSVTSCLGPRAGLRCPQLVCAWVLGRELVSPAEAAGRLQPWLIRSRRTARGRRWVAPRRATCAPQCSLTDFSLRSAFFDLSSPATSPQVTLFIFTRETARAPLCRPSIMGRMRRQTMRSCMRTRQAARPQAASLQGPRLQTPWRQAPPRRQALPRRQAVRTRQAPRMRQALQTRQLAAWGSPQRPLPPLSSRRQLTQRPRSRPRRSAGPRTSPAAPGRAPRRARPRMRRRAAASRRGPVPHAWL